ncbi:uncharacterized protein I303_102291 [Kwoniella dejecticola CBS 10117]|uniref:BTB domain-containing protein n=1 Tax=Kwoniella dejecticola CBS 10117 TaxID=1296121 RepID=A0A1A6ABD3_9TREE|nr:uncharacterized protein I303_01569 [Kwoniella dejecticola CBS 10117]OBR87367.1 hypothetical protein I303_01569 [Kwoniella dejecticola CBS 10117]
MSPEIPNTSTSETYNSEEADLTLISTDDVRFKVHSYEMKSHSSVLKDMLDALDNHSNPIPMELKSDDLKIFLDYMISPTPPLLNSWSKVTDILELADKWGSFLVHERISHRLAHLTTRFPWEVFCFASHEGNEDLARKAIGDMGFDESRCKISIANLRATDISGPTVDYLVGLINQLKDHTSTSNRSRYTVYTVDWEAVAKAFRPCE